MLRADEPSSNAERLSRLYDPAYVRQVGGGSSAPVQVCLDARMLDVEAGTGVASYAAVLKHCLARAGAAAAVLGDEGPSAAPERPRLVRWVSALDRRARTATPMDDGQEGWAAADLFREAQVFFNLHGRLLPVACARPPQVMHWTYPVPLFMVGARNLYTVHDLIPLSDPALTGISPLRHARLLDRIVARAAGLVTVSEATRRSVIGRLGCAEAFVTNTWQAALAPLQRDPPLPAGLSSGGYFLFCGTVEPRKNLLALVEAHARSGSGRPLVVVGPAAPGHERLEARLEAAEGVIRLPWQPRPMLLGLLRRCRALLFPSLAEGFGLPVAEAMTLGAPVMTSNDGALAEVAGEAALLVEPSDVAAMAGAIARLGQDDGLCARLRMAGFERARLFSPDAYSRRLRLLYAAVLDGPAGVATEEGG